MKTTLETSRLVLRALSTADATFILELVNSPNWIKFIGERNVKSLDGAIVYIQKLIDNPNVNYWVICSKKDLIPVGVITLIKREHLEHQDVGFALLPQFEAQGYAFEAAQKVLETVPSEKYLAITLPENVSSIRLIEKLGFKYHEQMVANEETLLVYEIDT